MKNHEAHLELQNIECHLRNLVSEAELEEAGATHTPGRPPHIRVMRLISHLKERAEAAEQEITRLQHEKDEKDYGAAAPTIPDVAKSVPASGLPNCVVLARAWMEAYVRAQETFDTSELDEFGYDASALLGQVVLEYEALAGNQPATEVSSSPAASPAQKENLQSAPLPSPPKETA